MILTSLDRYRDVGLLILRIGIGIAFMVHGFPKLIGGPEAWAGLAQFVGIDFFPAFFGLMAAISEFVGGILLALGLLFRPATFLMFCTMAGALTAHLGAGDDFGEYAHALELGIVFLSLFLIGPGTYSLDERLTNRASAYQRA